MDLVAAGVLALLLSSVLIRGVILSPTVRQRLLAAPVDNRWHTRPTPSLGGVPMYVAVAVSVLFAGGWGDSVAVGLLAGATVLVVVGVLDDLRDVSPALKLTGQAVAASLVVLIAGGEIHVVLALLAVPWIVLMANSVNLLDNMDGLAAGTSTATLVVLLPLIVVNGQSGLALVATATIGALIGFLFFNWSPAKLFMGDSGSMWLGMILASAVVLIDYGDRRFAPLAALTILAIPILDTSVVVVSRLTNGRSIFRGGRDHVSHRLVSRGMTDARAVITLTVGSLLCGLVGIAEPLLPTVAWLSLIALLWGTLGAAAFAMLRLPVYETASGRVVPPGDPA